MGKDLTQGGIYGTIIKTSLPMMIAFLFQSAFNIVDAFFVGKISAEALAAVSISFPIVFLIISLGAGIGTGATSVVARLVGGKKINEADNASQHALISSIIISIFLTIIGYFLAPYLMRFAGAEGSLLTLSLDYINILLVFSPCMLLMMVGNSILRAEGDMKTPMYIMAFSALLNIFLDPIFIFTLGLGVKGAAWATVISRLSGLVIFIVYILSGKSWIKLNFKKFKYKSTYIKDIFSIGVPSSLSNISMSIGMYLITVIVGLFGTDALAAFGIGFRLDSIAILPGLGITISVISIVGQSLGAGKIERAKEITLKAGILSSIFMTSLGGIFFIFAPSIIKLFNTDPEVIVHGVSFLKIIPISYMVVGIAMSISGAFLGAGKAKLALIITIFRVIVFSVPLAYVLSKTHQVSGIWAGMVLGTYLGALLSFTLFKKAKWYELK